MWKSAYQLVFINYWIFEVFWLELYLNLYHSFRPSAIQNTSYIVFQNMHSYLAPFSTIQKKVRFYIINTKVFWTIGDLASQSLDHLLILHFSHLLWTGISELLSWFQVFLGALKICNYFRPGMHHRDAPTGRYTRSPHFFRPLTISVHKHKELCLLLRGCDLVQPSCC